MQILYTCQSILWDCQHPIFASFEAFIAPVIPAPAPISNAAYVLGEGLAGMTRALLAGGVILMLGALFDVVLSYNGFFWLAFLLNSFVFSSLAVGLAIRALRLDAIGSLTKSTGFFK